MKNPGLAAVLSFFVVGLGQIYNGQIGKGLLMLVVYYTILILSLVFFWGGIFSIDTDAILTGIVGAPILGIIVVCIWISGISGAYRQAEKINCGGLTSTKNKPKAIRTSHPRRLDTKAVGRVALVLLSIPTFFFSIPAWITYWLLGFLRKTNLPLLQKMGYPPGRIIISIIVGIIVVILLINPTGSVEVQPI